MIETRQNLIIISTDIKVDKECPVHHGKSPAQLRANEHYQKGKFKPNPKSIQAARRGGRSAVLG